VICYIFGRWDRSLDNRKIELTLEGREDFNLAMKIAVEDKKVIGYRVHKNCLVLYWAENKNAQKLPYKMTVDEISNFVWGWLEKTEPEHSQPSHDGSNGKGFRMFNEAWGHVFGEWEAFIAITPEWAWYGK
jgi:hypothetical protein